MIDSKMAELLLLIFNTLILVIFQVAACFIKNGIKNTTYYICQFLPTAYHKRNFYFQAWL